MTTTPCCNRRATRCRDSKSIITSLLKRLRSRSLIMNYSLHILPPGFVKIRHYGILSSRAKPKLKMQQMKMGISIVPQPKMDWKQVARVVMGFDADACPCCFTGRMHTIYCFGPNAPPNATDVSIPHQLVA
jgi:hypothetical protein